MRLRFPALALAAVGLAAAPALAVPATEVGGSGPSLAPAEPASVLVRVRGAASPREVAAAHGAVVRRVIGRTGFVEVVAAGRSAQDLTRALRLDPDVAGAERNHVRHVAAIPDDPMGWGYTLGLFTPGTNQRYLSDLRLREAWDVTKGSDDVTIAIVDTGIIATHEDLAGRVEPGHNVLEPGETPQDENGHGTAMAGVAAATTDNGVGISGVAWHARILPVKVMDHRGQGTDADIATGITWAADHGADVILLAFAGADDSAVLRAAVTHAQRRDAVVVAATGAGGEAPVYPAALPDVLAVAATDWDGDAYHASGHGPWIDVAAPGYRIATPCTTWAAAGISYCQETGTSFSAAIVAGAAALVRAAQPSATQAAVVARIRATARDRGAPGFDPFYGYGVVDAYAAVGGPPARPELDRGDPAEPNGTAARATLVTGAATGTITPAGDEDWYRVDVGEPGRLTIAVSHPRPPPWPGLTYGGAFYDGSDGQEWEPTFAVYGPDLRPLAERGPGGMSDPSVLEAPAAVPGSYYVRVRNAAASPATAPYSLSIEVGPGRATSFAPEAIVPTDAVPAQMAVGDFTGDGRSDVVVGTGRHSDRPERVSRLYLLRQEDAGRLAAPVPVSAPDAVAWIHGLVATDLDGDGDDDLVAGRDGRIEVLYQRDGALGAAERLPGDTTTGGQVAAADLDGDGHVEIVVAGDGLSVLRSGATGYETTRVSDERTFLRDIALGDLDGNGRQDIALLATHPALRVYLHDAGGTFARIELPSLDAAGGSGDRDVRAVESGDVTGDGRDDLVVAASGNWGTSRAYVIAQTASGTLAAPVAHTSRKDSLNGVAIGDLDGDGREDVVIHTAEAEAAVRLQQTDGSLGAERLEPMDWGAPMWSSSLAIVDLNEDGRRDIVRIGDRGVGVLLQHSDAVRPAGVWVAEAEPGDLETGVDSAAAPAVRFANEMENASVGSATVRLRHGTTGAAVAATVAYRAGTRTVSIVPAAPLVPFAPYAFTIAGARDAAGRAMPKTTVRFRVQGALALEGAPVVAEAGTTFRAVIARLTDPEARPPAAYEATVDWGDGTAPTAAALGGSEAGRTLSADHAYASAGSYAVTVRVRDDIGRAAAATTTATVAASLAASPGGGEDAPLGPGPTAPTAAAPQALHISALRAMPARFRTNAVRGSAAARGPSLRFTASRASRVRLLIRPSKGAARTGRAILVRRGPNRVPLSRLLRGRTLGPGTHRLSLQMWDGRRWRTGTAVRVVVTR
jgi:subtilisin family serine protease